ncbi:hypothetical protein Scep_025738 [Stephania cephalantha]|uniref:26S proteasome regulatory subunit RPN2 C-terminal domain-containing protein n=1 Tax=Stephania cephalantha TaxID=152367 RepID=A0AAP0ESP7_9MAGN
MEAVVVRWKAIPPHSLLRCPVNSLSSFSAACRQPPRLFQPDPSPPGQLPPRFLFQLALFPLPSLNTRRPLPSNTPVTPTTLKHSFITLLPETRRREYILRFLFREGEKRVDIASVKKLESEPTFEILTNPARVVPAQEKYIKFLEDSR